MHRQAERLGDAREWAATERSLRQAIEALEDARAIIRQHRLTEEWAEVTATQAETERAFGTLLAAFPAGSARQESCGHFRRAVSLYSEAFDHLWRDQDQDTARVSVRDTLRSLVDASPEAQDARLGLAAGIKIFGPSFLSDAYSDVWKPLLTHIIRESIFSLSDFILMLGVTNSDQIIDRLTEIIASLALSEREVASALNAVFQRLGWSGLVVVQQVPGGEDPRASQGEARPVTAEELFGNVPAALQAKPRQKYVFAPELLDDREAFRVAQRIANARNYKIRNQMPLTAEENAQGLIANSFVNQARSRQRRRRAGEPREP